MNNRTARTPMYALGIRCCCLAILCLAVLACTSGPKPLKVTGTLMFDGKPYVPKHNGSLSVKFIPVVEEGQHFDSYLGEVNRTDGSFTVNGRTGQGIPPGKYRVVISQRVMDATAEIHVMNDLFSPENSKVLRDITDATPILIDLARPEGK